MNSNFKVTILCLDDNLEATAIRSALESFGITVYCHFIGNVGGYIKLINNQDSEAIIIICAHGEKQGTILAELDFAIEATMPYKRVITLENYQEFLQLNNQIIINTSCLGGDLAPAFLQSGAKAYIGADGYVDGSASTYFVISLLYNLFHLKLKLKAAYDKAVMHNQDTQMFRFFNFE